MNPSSALWAWAVSFLALLLGATGSRGGRCADQAHESLLSAQGAVAAAADAAEENSSALSLITTGPETLVHLSGRKLKDVSAMYHRNTWVARTARSDECATLIGASCMSSAGKCYFTWNRRDHSCYRTLLQADDDWKDYLMSSSMSSSGSAFYEVDVPPTTPYPFPLEVVKLTGQVYGAVGPMGLFFAQSIESVKHKHGRFDNVGMIVRESDFGSKDVLAAYRADDDSTCVLVFQGTNNVVKSLFDINVIWTTQCGARIHRGTWDAMMRMVGPDSQEWNEQLAPYLANRNTCARVVVGGHSLGGMAASLFAACANQGPGSDGFKKVNSKSPAFLVSAVYTIGAGGFALDDLKNGQPDTDGCFAGKRYFYLSSDYFDPVPQVGGSFGYYHPRMNAVRLGKNGENESYPCDSQEAKHNPTYRQTLWGPLASMFEHIPLRYMARIASTYADGDDTPSKS